MRLSFIIFILFFLAGCAVSKNPLRRDFLQRQKGRIVDDTSYIYALPYEANKRHLVIQGYFSHLSHKERAAIDFKMNKGTKVCAARAGIVVRVKEDGNRGGLNAKFRRYGNNIVIQHADGTRAGYWHLKKNGALVNVGDSVQQGQVIGLSGNTGYTITPHLHFYVWRYNERGSWEQVATRFQTSRGIKFLRPFRNYTHPSPR